MSDLEQEIKDLHQKIDELTEMLVGKMTGWIGEDVAAKMVGLSPKTFRERVKSNTINVSYTCNQGRRNTGYKYRFADIKEYLQNNSTAA